MPPKPAAITTYGLSHLLSVSGAQKGTDILSGTFHTIPRIFAFTMLLKSGRKYQGGRSERQIHYNKNATLLSIFDVAEGKTKEPKILVFSCSTSARASSFWAAFQWKLSSLILLQGSAQSNLLKATSSEKHGLNAWLRFITTVCEHKCLFLHLYQSTQHLWQPCLLLLHFNRHLEG